MDVSEYHTIYLPFPQQSFPKLEKLRFIERFRQNIRDIIFALDFSDLNSPTPDLFHDEHLYLVQMAGPSGAFQGFSEVYHCFIIFIDGDWFLGAITDLAEEVSEPEGLLNSLFQGS